MNTVYIVHVLVAVILLLCTKTSSSRSAEYLSKDGKMIRCIAEERKALLLLFKQDVANEHDLLPLWKKEKEEEEDCCKWKGVVCDNHTSHVTQLHLSSLIFPFYVPYSPFSIGNSLLDVPYINYLDLSNNHYLAEIPTFIGSLRNLVHLDLSNTSVTGSIPYQIGNLSNLQYLNLSHNYFSTIPKSIGSLNSLTYLDLGNSLSYNFIDSQYFEWLFNLSSLTYLDLSTIKIDIAPTTFWSSLIQRIPSISVIRLNDCYLNPPSSTISNFSSSITELHLHGNLFNSSIFHWLSHLRDSLIVLDLSLNKLDGSIPESFALMTSLTYLDLSANQVYGPISLSFGNMTALTYLDLSGNQFNGPIPLSFGNMSALTYLDLSANQLNGPIPLSFGNMTALTDLDLSENQLNGVLPQSIFDLPKLEVIDLSKNNFTSSLPDFTHLSSLRVLNVKSNQLNGYLPKVLRQNSPLQFLDLSHNHLRGYLPAFTGVSSLKYLFLDNNMFYGSIPDFTGCSSLQVLRLYNNKLTEWKAESTRLLSSLVELDLSMNSIYSTISEAHLSSLSSLTWLRTSYNPLTFKLNPEWLHPFQLSELSMASCKLGPKFPNWIRNQGYLTILDISNSEIADTIPPWFWNISVDMMQYLNLSSNKIRGKFSPKYVNIEEIDLSSNYFDGSLPAIPTRSRKINLSKNNFSGTLVSLSVGEGLSLSYLDISHNQLVGALPDYWMHFQGLAFLNLGYNNLTGRIPKSVGHLVYLQTLILRHNKLYGELPNALRNCSSLGFVDFGLNKLSGKVPSWIGEDLPHLYALILKSNRFYERIPCELCRLSNLHFLDLSINNISGIIPPCFGNFTAMIQKESEVAEHSYTTHLTAAAAAAPFVFSAEAPYADSVSSSPSYYDNVLAIWKGQEFEYGRNFALLKMIDLSTNELTGEIPVEITRLVELKGLNLSGNRFYGSLPLEIGQLKELECLDLSTNQFSGNIPLSLSALNFLAYLDLSDNNFWGRIPSGTQLQGFSDAYEGNTGLCGKPLKKICPEDEPADHVWPSSSGDDAEYDRWLYISSVLGFSTTFWGIIGTLVLNRRWRHAYFLFLDNLKERIYVVMAVQIARLQRKI